MRVAIGVFDSVERLLLALVELSAREAPNTPGTLLAPPGAFDGRLEEGLRAGAFDGPAGRPHLVRVTAGAERKPAPPVVADRSSRTELKHEHERIAELERWIGPRMAEELRRRIAEGGYLLLAPVGNASDEQLVCRILIKHAVGQVQVHDVTPEGSRD